MGKQSYCYILATSLCFQAFGMDQSIIFNAIKMGALDRVKDLVAGNRGIVDVRDTYGQTPLHIAAAYNQIKIAEILLAAGSQVDSEDHKGKTALHEAAKNDSPEMAQLLINAGASINCITRQGATPLHYTVLGAKEMFSVARQLLVNRALVDKKASDSRMPIHWASLMGHANIVDILLAHKADPNSPDKYGSTPLHLAAQFGQTAVAQTLIARGADVNAINYDKQTPLHLAVSTDRLALIKILIAAGAQLQSMDSRQCRPIDVARCCRKENVAHLLKEYVVRIECALERVPVIAQVLAYATSERLAKHSPMSLLPQIILKELVEMVKKEEIKEACLPRA